jgi:hypothetical protein
LVIGLGRHREHHHPTLCTTTKKKGRGKIRENSIKKNYGGNKGGKYGKKSTRKRKYGEKSRHFRSRDFWSLPVKDAQWSDPPHRSPSNMTL